MSWWRHQMETFSALLAICAGNSPVPGEFPTQRPVTRSFDVYFDLRPNKRLSKQSWGWWFETLSRPLWRHRNVISCRFSLFVCALLCHDFICVCVLLYIDTLTIQWHHNDRHGFSNHRRLNCLLNRLFRRRSKKTSKLRVTGLCREIHLWTVNSPHKGPVTRKMFQFDDVIMDAKEMQF